MEPSAIRQFKQTPRDKDEHVKPSRKRSGPVSESAMRGSRRRLRTATERMRPVGGAEKTDRFANEAWRDISVAQMRCPRRGPPH